MKTHIALGFAFLAFSQISLGQSSARPGFQGIPGYFDPTSGAFTPISQPLVAAGLSAAAAAAAATPSTGKFVVNFTIAIKSSIPTTYPISCSVNTSTHEFDASYNALLFLESASVVAIRSSATLATCSVTIPYSWTLLSPATDKVTLDYSISAFTSTGIQTRSSTSNIGIIPVPANTVTTTKTVSAVL
jgi:hypothetical protein